MTSGGNKLKTKKGSEVKGMYKKWHKNQFHSLNVAIDMIGISK